MQILGICYLGGAAAGGGLCGPAKTRVASVEGDTTFDYICIERTNEWREDDDDVQSIRWCWPPQLNDGGWPSVDGRSSGIVAQSKVLQKCATKFVMPTTTTTTPLSVRIAWSSGLMD